MPTIVFNQYNTIGFAILLLLLGKWLRKKVYVFEKFAIPSPVIGGFLFAIIALILRQTEVLAFEYNTTLQELFMVMFFTTVGFNASFKVLKKGGTKVILFLVCAALLCICQNAVAIGLAGPVGLEKGVAFMTGSTPMTGGHGTSAGIAPLIEESGVKGAEAVAVSAATFGLVAGSIMGGPLATSLIKKKGLKSTDAGKDVKAASGDGDGGLKLDPDKLAMAFFVILIAIGLGVYLTDWINMGIAKLTNLVKMPIYIGPMILGIVFRNAFEGTKNEMPMDEIATLGDICLSIFLAMALMTLKLWDLAEVFGPMIVLLLAQAVLMFLFARFVTFNVMGRNYDAAVLAAGHCGFGMGATPNGVANMESVCENYGYSETAFFVLPIVGGFFIDFVNIAIILGFLGFV